jgi:hypothetical protein
VRLAQLRIARYCFLIVLHCLRIVAPR